MTRLDVIHLVAIVACAAAWWAWGPWARASTAEPEVVWIQVEPIWKWEPGELPLDVVIDVEMEHWRDEVQEAMRWWNLAIGYEVFNQVDYLREGAGLIVVAPLVEADPPPPEKPKAGRARKDGHNGTVRALAEPAKLKNPVRTFAHEFGHILGLDHHPDERSVMYQTILHGEWRLLPEERASLLRWHLPSGARP